MCGLQISPNYHSFKLDVDVKVSGLIPCVRVRFLLLQAIYTSPRGRHHQQCTFSRRRLQQQWRVHQPVPILLRGLDGKGSGSRCQYKKCPGFNQDAIKRVSFKIV